MIVCLRFFACVVVVVVFVVSMVLQISVAKVWNSNDETIFIFSFDGLLIRTLRICILFLRHRLISSSPSSTRNLYFALHAHCFVTFFFERGTFKEAA